MWVWISRLPIQFTSPSISFERSMYTRGVRTYFTTLPFSPLPWSIITLVSGVSVRMLWTAVHPINVTPEGCVAEDLRELGFECKVHIGWLLRVQAAWLVQNRYLSTWHHYKKTSYNEVFQLQLADGVVHFDVLWDEADPEVGAKDGISFLYLGPVLGTFYLKKKTAHTNITIQLEDKQ